MTGASARPAPREQPTARLRRAWPRPFLPVHLFLCAGAAGGAAGVVLGAVLSSAFLPTLPFAVIEGAVPAAVAVLGAVLAGTWGLRRRLQAGRR